MRFFIIIEIGYGRKKNEFLRQSAPRARMVSFRLIISVGSKMSNFIAQCDSVRLVFMLPKNPKRCLTIIIIILSSRSKSIFPSCPYWTKVQYG